MIAREAIFIISRRFIFKSRFQGQGAFPQQSEARDDIY
jgi:hypothetical protein